MHAGGPGSNPTNGRRYSPEPTANPAASGYCLLSLGLKHRTTLWSIVWEVGIWCASNAPDTSALAARCAAMESFRRRRSCHHFPWAHENGIYYDRERGKVGAMSSGCPIWIPIRLFYVGRSLHLSLFVHVRPCSFFFFNLCTSFAHQKKRHVTLSNESHPKLHASSSRDKIASVAAHGQWKSLALDFLVSTSSTHGRSPTPSIDLVG